ncbi:hypothetical protein B0H63DRAFT_455240 [Podospora didyma]|uniref:Transporter n=1 Tax=Podospora didyma TaxID=330526 RepID=A0AAE0K1P6_9PEZI|nr:hypothetical protein B0H63DRAFT_455240 [Podospora didyma]
MSRALNAIELALHDDTILQQSVDQWRERASSSPVVSLLHRDHELGRLFKIMERDLDPTRRRIDGAFQALMSSMRIVESERAIRRAETVSRLTHLAFFFIPLTLVASVFGMNVNEIADHLTGGFGLSLLSHAHY